MQATGQTYDAIAAHFGVAHVTAYRWCNPDYAEKGRIEHKEWRKRHLIREREKDRVRHARKRATEAPYYRFLRELRANEIQDN